MRIEPVALLTLALLIAPLAPFALAHTGTIFSDFDGPNTSDTASTAGNSTSIETASLAIGN